MPAQAVDEHALEFGLQHVVVAVGHAAVGRRGEQLLVLERFENGCTTRGVEQRVAQLAGQVTQGRGSNEKSQPAGGQPVQHVARQIRADQPRPATQVTDRPFTLGAAAMRGREVKQMQTGRPAAGAARQCRRRLGRQVGLVDVAKQLLDLPRAKAQVVLREFEHVARDDQPRRVEAGRAPAAQNDHEFTGTHRQQRVHRLLAGRAGKLLQVVDEQGRRAWSGFFQGPDEFADLALRRRHREVRIAEGVGQRMAEIAGDGRLVALFASGSIPTDGSARGGELAQQRGLARSGGSHHQSRGGRWVTAWCDRRDQPLAHQAPRLGWPHLFEKDHRLHGDLTPGSSAGRRHPGSASQSRCCWVHGRCRTGSSEGPGQFVRPDRTTPTGYAFNAVAIVPPS